ncbi:ferredoxin [Ignicoccus pacificus DSM 13166]|uniref:Ferredoxin n=1 Tax=Ignicoccus pacificus DSM 13166 TaxID=940294 RepID=A0A977K9A7_9CREN|nr:ferredoxin [Ignicoccus pacificus DSM 13166]
MKEKFKVVIREWCKGCPICVDVCPAPGNVFEIVDGKPKVARTELCFGCGLCAELCPAKAIEIEGLIKPHRLPFNEYIRSLVARMV